MQCVAIPNIGVDLPFPNDCFFIGGNGYPKRYPVVTSFFRHQITNADERDRKKGENFNKLLKSIWYIGYPLGMQLKNYNLIVIGVNVVSVTPVGEHPFNLGLCFFWSQNKTIFFCPFSRQNFLFNQICSKKYLFPKKTIASPLQVKWMFPYGYPKMAGDVSGKFYYRRFCNNYAVFFDIPCHI